MEQDVITGNGAGQKADAGAQNTAGQSKRAPAPSASASIGRDVLALLQDDLYQLQQAGWTVRIDSAVGALVVVIHHPDHHIGLVDSGLVLDGVPVVGGV